MTKDASPVQRGGGLDLPRDVRAPNRPKTPDEELDEALALTFPASDAVAAVQPITVGSGATRH